MIEIITTTLTQYQKDIVLGKREAIKFLSWMEREHVNILDDTKIPKKVHRVKLNELYLEFCEKGYLQPWRVRNHFYGK